MRYAILLFAALLATTTQVSVAQMRGGPESRRSPHEPPRTRSGNAEVRPIVFAGRFGNDDRPRTGVSRGVRIVLERTGESRIYSTESTREPRAGEESGIVFRPEPGRRQPSPSPD